MIIKRQHNSNFFIPLLGIFVVFFLSFFPSHSFHFDSKCKFNDFKSSTNKIDKANFLFVENVENYSNLFANEIELELEYDLYNQFSQACAYFQLLNEEKLVFYKCFFVSIKNKVPLYKLFCKWKLHRN